MKSMLKQREMSEVAEHQNLRLPRVVYTHAPLMLAVVLARETGGWRVRLGQNERVIGADPLVDPTLLDQAAASGARALVDSSAEPIIVGLLVTGRSIGVDREGNVDASVQRFRVTVAEEALLKTRG